MRIYNYAQKKSPSKNSTNKNKSKVEKFKSWVKDLNWKKIGTWTFRVGGAGVLLLAFLFIYYGRQLPDPNRLIGRNVPQSTKIYDRNENLLYEISGDIKRTLVDLDQISPYAQNATIAVEDKNFYNHRGISVAGLGRAIFVDVTTGSKSQGGSTITQQFVKNAVLTNEKSFIRKLKEIILSIEIEARFSKAEILKLYLNEIPYGGNTYGIEAASQKYFSKHAVDLSIAESAYLAALPQAPTFYNPNGPNVDALHARQKKILNLMEEQGYITAEQKEEANNEDVVFSQTTQGINAPHFVQYIQSSLAEKYGETTLEQGGFKVITTLDGELQKQAEDIVKSTVEKNQSKYKAYNGALVATDPKTGQILAMVGSKDYFADSLPSGCTPGKNCLFEPNVNVTTSLRQPGSSFKPYAYLTAFDPDHGYSPATMLMDVVTNFGDNYTPRNYNGSNYGPVSMRKALAGSLNVSAVKTLALVGVNDVTETARKLGITSPLENCGLSLVLGGCEVKLLDHVSSYATIADLGTRHSTVGILKLTDGEGKVLEEYQDKTDQVIDPQAAYQLIDVMTDNSARSYVFGSNSALNYPGKEVACKTGTTQEWRDGWTLCFTPNIAIGAWVGNNDGTLMAQGADGSFVAAPMVNALMNASFKTRPADKFTVPSGINRVTVDAVSGKLPTAQTPTTKSEIFADYNKPTQRDDVHVVEKIDTRTGALATDSTPDEFIKEMPFTVFRSERPDNSNWESPVIAWAKANGYVYPSKNPNPDLVENETTTKEGISLSITQPKAGQTIESDQFNITVKASVADSKDQTPNKIEKVELTIDGKLVATGSTDPYKFLITNNLSDGEHTVTATATDSVKNKVSTSIKISVSRKSETDVNN